MTTKENLKYQLLRAGGFAFEILFTIFWAWFGHNLPPASPNLSAQELATHFALHHNAMPFGNSMAALVAVLWIPWTAQLAVVMWRIEGSSPVLTIIQLNRRYPYRLGGDVLPRDLGGRGVPPVYRSEPGPPAQRFGLFPI